MILKMRLDHKSWLKECNVLSSKERAGSRGRWEIRNQGMLTGDLEFEVREMLFGDHRGRRRVRCSQETSWEKAGELQETTEAEDCFCVEDELLSWVTAFTECEGVRESSEIGTVGHSPTS